MYLFRFYFRPFLEYETHFWCAIKILQLSKDNFVHINSISFFTRSQLVTKLNKNYKYNTWHHNIAQDQKEGCCKTLFLSHHLKACFCGVFSHSLKNEDSSVDSSYSIYPTSYDFHAFSTLVIYKQVTWNGVAETNTM